MSSPLFTIRLLLGFFILGLAVSGLTAFPLVRELEVLAALVPAGEHAPGGMAWWILHVREGVRATDAAYPFIFYGTDWLAFGHLVIAAFFVAPMIDPVRHRATLYTGVWACAAVLAVAMVCGPIRGIPVYWRLIDCAFGVLGVIPLWIAIRLTKRLENGEGLRESRLASPRSVP
jgi:hypothetical protein